MTLLCWFMSLLCYAVVLQKTYFSININGRSHAGKCLTGWSGPVTGTEDEAALWCPLSCVTDSVREAPWLEKMEEAVAVGRCGRLSTQMMSVFVRLQRRKAGDWGAVAVYRTFFIPWFDPIKPISGLLSPPVINKLNKAEQFFIARGLKGCFFLCLRCFFTWGFKTWSIWSNITVLCFFQATTHLTLKLTLYTK